MDIYNMTVFDENTKEGKSFDFVIDGNKSRLVITELGEDDFKGD